MNEAINNILDQSDQLNKDDVMQLLETALKNNDPFAREFSERVAPHVAHLIRTSISVAPIKIDGAGLGTHIIDTLQEQTDKKLDDVSKQINKQLDKVVDNVSDSTKSSLVTNLSLDLNELLGRTESFTATNTHRYQKLVDGLMHKVEAAVTEPGNVKLQPIVNVTDLFPKDPSTKLSRIPFIGYELKYQNLMRKVLGNLTTAVNKTTFNFAGTPDPNDRKKSLHNVELKSIFGINSKADWYTSFRWNILQRKLISMLDTAIKGVKFTFGADNKTIGLSDVFGIDKKTSLWTQHMWNGLQRRIIKSIKVPDSINLEDIINKQFTSITDDVQLGKLFQKNKNKDVMSDGTQSLLDEPTKITLYDIEHPAYKKLDMLFDKYFHRKDADIFAAKKKVEDGEAAKKTSFWNAIEHLLEGGLLAELIGKHIKPLLVAGSLLGRVIAGAASLGTTLLLVKQALELGRSIVDVKYREQKEEEFAKTFTDPNTSWLKKAWMSITDFHVAYMGMVDEDRKRFEIFAEGQQESIKQGKAIEQQLASKMSLKDFEELKRLARSSPEIKDAYEHKERLSYEDFDRLLHRKMVQIYFEKTSKNFKSTNETEPDTNDRGIPSNTLIFPKNTPQQIILEPVNKEPSIVPIQQENHTIEQFLNKFKDIYTPNSTQQEAFNSSMNKAINELNNTLNNLVVQMKNNKQDTIADVPASRDALPAVAMTDTRDPAYILRSRAWDRLREGYVVI